MPKKLGLIPSPKENPDQMGGSLASFSPPIHLSQVLYLPVVNNVSVSGNTIKFTI
jgi:hypothetical protein